MSNCTAITILNLEFNSSCNLRCKWCALDHSRERKHMSRETLERVMGELATNPFENLKRIDLHNGGETLLHPNLPEMLSVIRRYRPQISPNVTTGLLTNAMLLSPKVSEQIIRSRAVDQIRFSIDGGSPAAFEEIRSGARWEVVKRNVETFLQINAQAGKPVTSEIICMIPAEGLPGGEAAPEFRDLLQKADKVSLRHPHNWDGSADLDVDDSSYKAIAEKCIGEPCFLLERNMVVFPDGSVTICCNDLNGRGVYGSILSQSFRELADHPVRNSMLKSFREGRKQDIPLCRDCTGFYTAPR